MKTCNEDALTALQEIKTGNKRHDDAIAFAIAAVRMNQWLMEDRESMSSMMPYSASLCSVVPFDDEFLEFSKQELLDYAMNEIQSKVKFSTYKDSYGYVLRLTIGSNPRTVIPVHVTND